jgi:copper chaperone
MEVLNLKVEGMTCQHCVKSVRNSITALSGIKNVDVSLSENRVTLEYEPEEVSTDKIISAITEEGYKVVA